MRKTMASAFVLGLVGLAGCPDIQTDPDEVGPGAAKPGPTVEFDPAAAVVPFPNNLLLNPMTGRVNLPRTCGEGPAAAIIRATLLNTLDGFGTYEAALQVQLSDAVDPASLDSRVLLYQRAKGTMPNAPASAIPIPVVTRLGVALQYSPDCATSKMVTSLTIVARGVLEPGATYTVALTKGIKTTSGAEFGPSFTWALIGQADAPATFDSAGKITANRTPLDPAVEEQLEQLRGINLLWGAHKAAVDFVAGTGKSREDILIAWEFNTQTNDAIDPTVAGTPAATAAAATQQLQSVATIIPPGVTPTQVLASRGIPCDSGDGTGLPCAAVGDILAGGLLTTNYQTEAANPIGGAPIPGAWTNPGRPTVITAIKPVEVLAVVPSSAMPPDGWPTVIFGHGLASSKTSMFLIAPQLARAGFAVVSIDFVAHDSRAVRITEDAARGCADDSVPAPTPTGTPQCYAPILSGDLAQTRDNIRQTVLDLQRLVAALKVCGTANCGALKVDTAHLTYMGMSLGGIVGSTFVAQTPDIKGAVLNVPAVGLLDVVENTKSLPIRCSTVDGLIDAGILVGIKSNATTGVPLCADPAQGWKTQPGYQQFSVIARWALDPADGANFTRKLAARKILIQEVVDDEVVPNIATENEAALVGLVAVAKTADPFVPPAPGQPPVASTAITDMPTANKFVRYPAVAANPDLMFPGNTFQHGSLLLPVGAVPGTPGMPGTPAGQLGTARIQTDAIIFLVNNH